MKDKLKILILTVALCIATAVVASAATKTETVLGYKGKTYNISISGDKSVLSAQGTSSSVYTTLRNTSTTSIYGVATTKTCTQYWRQTAIDSNDKMSMGKDVVVVAPTVTRDIDNTYSKYIHEGKAYNLTQTTVYDTITYRVNHNTEANI